MDRQPIREIKVEARGISRRYLDDLYHRLLAGKWGALFALFVAIYLGINTAFAGGLMMCGEGAISAVPEPDFRAYFFFSIQTMSTVGYGTLAPTSACANWIVTAEVIVGLAFAALVTGMVYGKFSKPTSRIIFTDRVILDTWEGAPALMLRLGNARTNELVAATVDMCALVPVETEDGHKISQLIDLTLRRRTSPLFQMSWLLIHPIDEDSPFHGRSIESIVEDNIRLVVSVTAHDGNLGQTVYARSFYTAGQFVQHRRFVDVIEQVSPGHFTVDYARFHETVPSIHHPNVQ